MRVLRSVAEIAANPNEGCFLTERASYAVLPCGLHVCVLSGVVGALDLAPVIEVLVAMLASHVPVHETIVDLRALEGADESVFRAFEGYVETNRERLTARIARVAVVPPEGLFGAAARGFFSSVAPPYETKVLAMNEALAWLGRSADALAPLDEIRAHVNGPAIVRSLRALLASTSESPSLGAAARTLGVSPRALQRALREDDTSFREEQRASRMRIAERLLAREQSISEVAYAVGCASPAHFSVLFRRWSGVTPSEWRAARV